MSYMAPLDRGTGIPAAYLAVVCFLFSLTGPVDAQSLSPSNTGAAINTLSFSWTDQGGPYTAALSTAADFSVTSASGPLPLAALTTTYVGLAQDERYYFRVKRASDPDAAYESPNPVSTVTLAAAPSDVYFEPTNFASESAAAAQVGIGWSVNGNPEWTSYLLEYSKDPGLAGASTFLEPYPPVAFGALEANTVYYFRLRARNMSDVPTSPTAIASTATLARSLSSVNTTVHETSSTVSWQPLNDAVQSQRAEGYRLILSANPDLEPRLQGWSTADNGLSSATLTGLGRNSVYYYRIGTLNLNGAMNSDYTRSFTTLASTTNLVLLERNTQTAMLAWDALPQSPSSASAAGYRLEASTTNFSGGVSLTTSTYDVRLSTLTVQNVLANTTYYFRMGTLNQDNAPNYTAKLSTITLAIPLSANLLSTDVTPTGVRVRLNSPLPSAPRESSCEGYLLQASSINFTGGSVIHSSFSYSNLTDSLTVAGLRSNTAYHLRMGTLNWDRTPNFTTLPDATTLVSDALPSAALHTIWESSAAVSFESLVSDGYVLEAANTPTFIPVAFSSATTDQEATGLTVSGLKANTVYHFRAGALYNGATVYTLTTPGTLSTLAQPLGSPALAGVFRSSVAVSWTPLQVISQETNAGSYRLEASTSPDFSPVAYSSATYNTLLDRLTVQDLAPNTSYYFRAATLNWDEVGNYAYTSGTATLAAPPVQQAFTELSTDSMKVNWLAALNPPDTRYLVRFSSNSGFSPPVYSSITFNSNATFTGLTPNTTYYPEVTAFNRLDVQEGPYIFDAIATIAYDPVPGAYSVLGVSSVTLNWDPDPNPAGTFYIAQISSDAGFSQTVLSSVTQSHTATFSGLLSNTSYYLRIAANNHSGITTAPIPLGTALTLPATAFILPPDKTFSGMMTDGFTLNWSANGNSSLTVYDVLVSTAEDFNDSASSAAASAQGLAYTFRDLEIDTVYWARVQARGQAGATAATMVAGSTRTLLSNVENALISRDNSVTLQTSYGLISVLMPAGSLGGSTRIEIRPESSFPPPASSISAMRPTGVGLEITAFPSVLILNSVTIVLPYRTADLPGGIDRSRLVLALYDPIKNVWVPLPSVSDTSNNKVTAQTWHLSTFQLMETPLQVSLNDVKIYPNPFTPSSISGVMHFDNLPPYSTVRIYTFLGELVQDFSADVNGMAYWDGNNSNGRKAASGVYIAMLRTQDKRSKKIVKVIIER